MGKLEHLQEVQNRRADDIVGLLAFDKNKVASVSKMWGFFDGNEVAAFGKALASALSGLSEKDRGNATVNLRQIREPGISIEDIDLIFTKKTIHLSITDNGASIQENLYK